MELNGNIIGNFNRDTGKKSGNLSYTPVTFALGKYSPGKLKVCGSYYGTVPTCDSVITPGPPSALRLWVDESGRPPKAGVNDAVFVYAVIIDKDGNRVPVTGPEIQFGITGDAIIVNPESTGITEAGIATALVRIGETPGIIDIRAQANGLLTADITFLSVR